MSRIKGKNTKPELIIRKALWAKGYRYRLHDKKLPGKPDLVFWGKKKVVFINGCFWHKHNCRDFKWPKSNIEFWKNKIQSTVKRDLDNYAYLDKAGWSILVVWECSIKKERKKVINEICIFLDQES
tara:strand:+ start:170 stop:547 length:378 start_codon:yes stop_codon:yes gene_type:complete